MKKVVPLLLFCLCRALITLHTAEAEDTIWKESFYSRYDTDTFPNYVYAQEFIDFKDIHYPLLNAAIFYATNRMRVNHGKSPFIHARPLEEAAFMHARDMVREGFFSHQNPYESKKRTLSQRLAMFGVEEGYRAENISEMFGIRYEQGTMLVPPARGSTVFRDYSTGKPIPNHTYLSFAETLLGEWMKSTGHRANILNVNLHYLGCGAYHYRNESFYGMDQFKAVQNFASTVPDE